MKASGTVANPEVGWDSAPYSLRVRNCEKCGEYNSGLSHSYIWDSMEKDTESGLIEGRFKCAKGRR